MSRARAWKSVEEATVCCMPDVLLTSFFSAEATRMTARMLGQWDAGATSTAKLSLPSAKVPDSQATYPPKRERQAEPDPCLAILESSVGEVGSS